MSDTELRPTVTEIIEGPVASVDRVYAFDRLRDMCRAAPRAVRRVRTRLTAPPQSTPGGQAAAEGTLLLDGELIVCAGVTATTMREAIDLLMVRLGFRLRRWPSGTRISRSVACPRAPLRWSPSEGPGWSKSSRRGWGG